jgi:thiol-disulfide isomerase/thioredoxin
MNQRVLAALSIAALAVLVIGAVVYVKLHPSQQLQNASSAPVNAGAAIGQAAPEFTIPTTAGPFDLKAQTKPIFVEIFATWCPHCQHETVVINQLYAKFQSSVAFVSVPGSDTGMDGTSPASQADLLAFQTRFGITYPIAEYDPNLTVAKQYLKGGYPTIAIVSKEKKIVYLNSGEIPYVELDKQLAAVSK